MKTRIALTLAVLLGLPFLNRAFFGPVETIVKNKVAVATINGGDASYLAEQATHSGFALGSTLLFLGALIVIGLIWSSPVKKFLSEQGSENV